MSCDVNSQQHPVRSTEPQETGMRGGPASAFRFFDSLPLTAKVSTVGYGPMP